MSMRMRVVHTTRFSYGAPVTSSYNEARLTPQTAATQTTLESHLRTDPAANVLRYTDYWGTQVAAFDLHRPHDQLDVVATSVVETSPFPAAATRLAWADLQTPEVRNAHAELLAPTPYTTVDPTMAALLAQVSGQPDPTSAVLAASALVRDQLTYRSGATGVATTAAEAWASREGVCQDFAHITVALLRGAGIPARYVSGYLHPALDPVVGATVVGESHAWVEGWVGDWMAVDPTNEAAVGQRHVIVGRARDYADVSPLRGVYAGPGGSSMEVSVTITRLR